MTIEEFNKTGFTGQMRCTYKGEEYLLASVDFEEQIIGILLPDNQEDDYELTWVRCENVELKDNVVLRQPDVSGWVAYDWNDIDSRPKIYGKYFVHRKDGKVHWETWNGSGWAYNENVITHWQEVKTPCH